jgi:phytoene synthase
MTDSPAEHCGRDLQRLDPDRWLSALFAPDARRPALFALYAFNSEIARARESVSQPMIGQIRLQWWREAWDGIRAGTPRQHPVVLALYDHCRDLDLDTVLALIDARERDMEGQPFADLPALKAYAEATSVPLMKLAVQCLGATADEAMLRAAGTAYALTGILRAMPHLLARQRVMLPADLLAAQGLTPEATYQTECGPALRPAMMAVAGEAADLLQAAHRYKIARAALPAVLPAALVGRYLRALEQSDYDPLLAEARVTPLARQMRLLWASVRGRI